MFIPNDSVEDIYTQLLAGAKRSVIAKNTTTSRSTAASDAKPFVWNTTLDGTRSGTHGTSLHNSTQTDNNKSDTSVSGKIIAFVAIPIVATLVLLTLLRVILGPRPGYPNAKTNTPLSTRPTTRHPRPRHSTTSRRSRPRTPSPWRSTNLPEMTSEPSVTTIPGERPRRPYPSTSRALRPSPPPAGVPSREPRPYTLTAVAPIPMSELDSSRPAQPPAYEMQNIRRLSEDVGVAEPPPVYRTRTRDGERVLVGHEVDVDVPAPVYRREWNPWAG